MCYYNVVKDIAIPILSALISGGITFLGVRYTIKEENKTARKDYIEMIRPFFVIEMYSAINLKKHTIKDAYTEMTFDDDSSVDTITRWDGLIVSNVSDNVSVICYVRINGKKYNCISKIPIKPGEFCEIHGTGFSFIAGSTINSISIGFYDRQFNLYEYPVEYSIVECDESQRFGTLNTNQVTYSTIDCSKNLVQKADRRSDHAHHRKTI